MKHFLGMLTIAALIMLPLRAADDVVSAVHGIITKVDAASRTIVVKAKDGTEQTIHFVAKTTVRGGEITADAAKDTFQGLKEGSEVVAHYTLKGTEKTAVEVDNVGKDGMKPVEGTVTKVGEGTERVFDVAGHDTKLAAVDVGKAADKTGKVTVYYTEQAGKKVAHFFEKL
jgi:hypothetical protein